MTHYPLPQHTHMYIHACIYAHKYARRYHRYHLNVHFACLHWLDDLREPSKLERLHQSSIHAMIWFLQLMLSPIPATLQRVLGAFL